MINDALESLFLSFLTKMQNTKGFSTDIAISLVALSIFYVGRAIFKVSEKIGGK